MTEKELLKMLGLDSKEITLTLDDEYNQIKKKDEIKKLIKEVEEENEKERMISNLKKGYEDFEFKKSIIDVLKSRYGKNELRTIMLELGAPLNCPHCLYDRAGTYGTYAKQVCKK